MPSWRVYFFPTERERERKREKVFRVVLLLLLREGDDDQYQFLTSETRLSFFLFVLTGVCDEEHVLSLSVVEEEVCRKREESNVACFFYLRFAFSRAQRSLFLRGFKGDDDHKIWKVNLKLPGVFDYSKCSEPKNLHPRYFFFFDPLAHAVFFTHTQKHTHRRAQETQFSLKTCRLYRTQAHFMVTRCVVLIVDDDKKRISPPPPKRTSIGRSASRRGW